MNIYQMYEDQKVPWVHRLPEITPDSYIALSRLDSVEQGRGECKLNFCADNGETVCLSVTFPKLGGIHITAEEKGFFTCDNFDLTYGTDGDSVIVQCESGYSVRLNKGDDFSVRLLCGEKAFYSIGKNTVLFGYLEGKRRKSVLNTPIHKEEKISGFGEKYNTINQVGHILPLWNDDTGYHGHPEEGDKIRSYKNVPIFHSSLGYSVFYNSFYGAFADLTENNNTQLRLEFNSPLFDVYFWQGTVAENLNCYTALTGKPVLPPKWAFEFWAGGTGESWNSKGRENYISVFKEAVDGYKKMGTIPSAIYGEASPSQTLVCHELAKSAGIRMLAWNHPGVDVYIKGYNVQRIRDIFPGIEDKDIPMFRNPETNEILNYEQFYIDYSHPKAHDLIYNKYDTFWNWGLKGAMVDFGEFVHLDTKAYNGMLGDEMHNFNAYCYSKTIHDVWQERNGDDYILFARAACAGTQKWVGFFGGDQRGEFYGLRQAYYGGLNAGLSGFTVWGSDIGSLCDCKSEELYLRWLQFAAFSPLMRTHGNHNAWTYGEHCEEIFKKYFWFRKNILNYIYSTAVESHLEGTPIMRIMSACYPDDRRLLNVDDQYMFGDNMMVCPVLYEAMRTRKAVLPEGGWFRLNDGEYFAGGRTVDTEAPIDICPVFIKAGSIIPITMSEKLGLAEAIGEATEGLLIAPGEGKALIRESESIYYEFILQNNEGELSVKNPDGYSAGAIKLIGNVSRVYADGAELEVMRNVGFSTVRLQNDNWKELQIIC